MAVIKCKLCENEGVHSMFLWSATHGLYETDFSCYITRNVWRQFYLLFVGTVKEYWTAQTTEWRKTASVGVGQWFSVLILD